MGLSLRKIWASSLVPLVLAGAARSDSPESQRIIDTLLQALGGRETIAALRGVSTEAHCTGPDGGFRTRVDSFRPGLTYFEQSAGDTTTAIWSTSERTWRQTADGGVEDLGSGVRDFVRAHEFHLLLFELESRFSDHRPGGVSSVNGQACRSIEMKDASGRPASVCVAAADGLPLILEMSPDGAEGPIRITFDDWRQIAGLRYFFAFTLTEGPERTFTYSYERIEPNSVSADHFVSPAPAHRRDDQNAILDILRQDRRAHLETDASLIASHLAETLFEISAGRVRAQSREEVEGFFRTMLEGADYEMWEDSAPPVIHISADASMAWVARTVRVRRQASGPDGGPSLQEFSSAYTSTYEMQDGDWKMTSVTSTFLPD